LSFYQMKQLGVQVDNMRYFNFHENNHEIEFRDFVEGFPIFNADGLDTIKVAHQAKQTTTSFSIYNLDVPVPTSKSDKELPSTQDMLDELKYSGINTDKIEDIDIGYERPSTTKANSTVELEPTWFIKYHGDWTSYRDLVS
jgi:regulatory protein YycH of two-component signal transduction system YycFG